MYDVKMLESQADHSRFELQVHAFVFAYVVCMSMCACVAAACSMRMYHTT